LLRNLNVICVWLVCAVVRRHSVAESRATEAQDPHQKQENSRATV